MKKSQQTRRTLTGSLISLIVCIAMLIGTTLAWFTDTASTSVNKIQAGNLKVALVDEDGNPLTDALQWQKATGHEDEAVLWEPGATYNLQRFKVKNNGNLALKYKIKISGIEQGDAELLNVLQFTYNEGNSTLDLDAEHHLKAEAESGLITISAKMDESAGNEYKGMSVEGIVITVVATQDTVESDSNNNEYDKNATYPVASQKELDSSIENSTEGTVVVIPSDTTMTLKKDSVINDGVTLAGAGADKTILKTEDKNYNIKNDNITIKDVTIDGTASSEVDDNSVIVIEGNNVVLDGVKAIGGGQDTYGNTVKAGSDTTIKNSTISGAFRGIQAFHVDEVLLIENTILEPQCYCLNIDAGTGKLVVNNSTLKGWTSYTNTIESATFTNTNFEVNTNPGSYGYNCVRGYTDTTFVNCNFGDEFWFGGANGKVTVTFENCKYKGTLITKSNVKDVLEPTDNANTTVIVK